MPPTQKALKNEIMKMISSGELLLGNICSPYSIIQFTVKDGTVIKKTNPVLGRKIHFHTLRKSQEHSMHLYSDETIKAMNKDELEMHLRKIFQSQVYPKTRCGN